MRVSELGFWEKTFHMSERNHLIKLIKEDEKISINKFVLTRKTKGCVNPALTAVLCQYWSHHHLRVRSYLINENKLSNDKPLESSPRVISTFFVLDFSIIPLSFLIFEFDMSNFRSIIYRINQEGLFEFYDSQQMTQWAPILKLEWT